MRAPKAKVALNENLFRPGLRLAVGLSGGADSVALLRVLADRSRELGLVVHAAHLHHGLRGVEADADRDFCRELAYSLGLPFQESQVDTACAAAADPASGKAAESIEEAARRLRYGWFRELMRTGIVDAVATAHTRDDQAETVLARFLRGAWTEGLSGIHPVVAFPEGRIVRPILATGRAEVEAYLKELDQKWREDSTNRHLTFTRNRIRHDLLPLLEEWNPQLREHLAQMAELARDEEDWWGQELKRLAAQLILPGRPVRGGGRASGEGLAIEVARLAEIPVAAQRRLLRHAAGQLGAKPDFEATEALRGLALAGRAGQRRELAAGLGGERTHRELRLTVGGSAEPSESESSLARTVEIPGETVAPEWGFRLQIHIAGWADRPKGRSPARETPAPCRSAILRPWKPGDRVRLRHSGGPRKVKEVLERMRVSGPARAHWPVLELDGRIIWMQGVELEPEPDIEVVIIQAQPADDPAG
jgi:tRNA(Ile)-lysidine synthase